MSLFSVIKMASSRGTTVLLCTVQVTKLLWHDREACQPECHGQTLSDVLWCGNVTALRDCSPEQMRVLSACLCDECQRWKTGHKQTDPNGIVHPSDFVDNACDSSCGALARTLAVQLRDKSFSSGQE